MLNHKLRALLIFESILFFSSIFYFTKLLRVCIIYNSKHTIKILASFSKLFQNSISGLGAGSFLQYTTFTRRLLCLKRLKWMLLFIEQLLTEICYKCSNVVLFFQKMSFPPERSRVCLQKLHS